MNKTFLRTLLYAASFVLLCTGIIGTAVKRGGKNLKEVQTALLNPKYVQDINTIRLRQNTNDLTLFKDGGFWFVRIEGHALRNASDSASVFPADSRRVDDLINTFRKVRKMYIISDRGGSEAFFIHNDAVFTLDFAHTEANEDEQDGKRSGERVFSSLHIAVPKNGTKTLHIAPAANGTDAKHASVYACEDDASVFLNYNPSFWADGKLIPDCLRGGKGENDVQKLILREYRSDAARGNARDAPQRTLIAGDGAFESAVHTLFEARTAQITTIQIDTVQAGGASAAAGETPVSSLSAVFADGSEASFSVYKRGTDYSAVPENPYTAVPYALSVSEWTYESLIDPFRR